ncbi:MAG: hypothetical protein GX096_09780 [Clostridiales bacterium]|nr:hypothetical protein [Clostridiales bacterium]
MTQLKELPEIASRQLGGFVATPNILAKAKITAADYQKPKMRNKTWQTALAISTALALCVGAAVWVVDDHPTIDDANPHVIDSYSAGENSTPTAVPHISADVPVGSISMSSRNSGSAGTLYADSNGSSFPLVTIDGATYRMLTSPSSVSNGLLGDKLGSVGEFNVEPALGSSGVISNTVARGEEIYAIAGLGSSMIAAPVDGSTRVFQRVSYAGTAIIGNETLEDTLCSASDVKWITLSGVGTIDDAATVQELMQTMLDNADYIGTSVSGSTSMQIGLTNGLTLQLMVGDDAVSACGTWSCPDFFEAFSEAVQ